MLREATYEAIAADTIRTKRVHSIQRAICWFNDLTPDLSVPNCMFWLLFYENKPINDELSSVSLDYPDKTHKKAKNLLIKNEIKNG